MIASYFLLLLCQTFLWGFGNGEPPVTPPTNPPTTNLPTTNPPTTHQPTTNPPTTNPPTTNPPTTNSPTTTPPNVHPPTTAPATPGCPSPPPVSSPSSATPGATPSAGSTEIILPAFSKVVKQSMTVYYDAMEQNSQLFFNTTLMEKFNIFYSYIDFTFVPCQQAQIIDGELFCYSSVDPTCTMNKVHSCAIAQTDDRLVLTKFLMCTMKGTAALSDYNTCATSSGISTTKLQTCITTDLGKQLCIAFKAQKSAECSSLPGFIFKNPKDIIPTDPFDHFLNDACSADFTSTTCSVLKSSDKPAPIECNKEKLAVSISYKIMDENSYKVFQEWAKIYDKFSKFIKIKYQPCMFAEMNNGHLDCKAETDKDCVTGKMHSCAISLVKDDDALFKFIACSSQDPKNLADFEKCANDNKVDFKAVKDCVDTDQGTRMCYQSSKTRPDSDEMPVIRFETKFNNAASKESWTNPQFVLCQQLKYYNLTYPDDCKGEAKLSLFYDSLDPQFQCFLNTKFMENYQKFSLFVKFEFVPCRTAKEDNNNLACASPLDKQCYIDKFESCAIKNYPDNNAPLKVLLCLSQFEGELLPDPEACATSASVDGAKLKACADGDDGKKLCIENMKKAPKNDRSFAFVFNDKFDENVDKSLGDDFVKGLCEVLKNNKLTYPVDCYPTGKEEDSGGN